jgi:hypothetical protein
MTLGTGVNVKMTMSSVGWRMKAILDLKYDMI